jgi:hypothetical protein
LTLHEIKRSCIDNIKKAFRIQLSDNTEKLIFVCRDTKDESDHSVLFMFSSEEEKEPIHKLIDSVEAELS